MSLNNNINITSNGFSESSSEDSFVGEYPYSRHEEANFSNKNKIPTGEGNTLPDDERKQTLEISTLSNYNEVIKLKAVVNSEEIRIIDDRERTSFIVFRYKLFNEDDIK